MRSLPEEFAGRIALVTAAAGDGVGQATARRLAAGGATVIVTDIHERRTKEVSAAIAADYGATVIGLPLDVSDRGRVHSVLRQVEAETGPVQILVNNAAINVQGDIFDYDADLFERIVATDLTACWYLAMLAGQQMKRAGGGVIVNIGSIAADIGSAAYEPAYTMSKGAMRSLTQGLAKAGGPFNIRCNEVTMGIVSGTRFMSQQPDVLEKYLPQVPLGRHATPADIAEAVAFLASDRSSFITGEVLSVCGGFLLR
jgi:NAD(P)-dependent dehydrogenase (short-subunit alcohol dehydrogenase family)